MERPSTPPEIRLPSETSPSWAEGPVTPSRNGCAFSPDSAANATSEVDPAHETSLTSSKFAPTAIGVSDRLSPGLPALSRGTDRKSTRLNSSHVASSYAVFCLKKTTITTKNTTAFLLLHIYHIHHAFFFFDFDF